MLRIVSVWVGAGLVIGGLGACASDDDPEPPAGTSSTSTTSSTGTTTSSSGTACDVGDCQLCGQSSCANEQCAAELSACVDGNCLDASVCYGDCNEDPTCIDSCRATYPDEAALFDALWYCVACDPGPCSVDCAAHVLTSCGG